MKQTANKGLSRSWPKLGRSRPSGAQSGVAYVELLVVIAIIAVVATLALMSWGQSREKLKLQNAANGLKIAFQPARFDSVNVVRKTSILFQERTFRNVSGRGRSIYVTHFPRPERSDNADRLKNNPHCLMA